MLAEDETPERRSALNGEIAKGIESFKGHWFQRIDYPEHWITLTSNREWAYIDEGGLNTLGNRLTGVEIIRPQYESAVWSAEVLKHDTVFFLNTDARHSFSVRGAQ